MTGILNFVIPILHPENAKNWHVVKKNLEETMRSISGQISDNWRATIVANKESDLPELRPKFQINYVDFPPNPIFEKGSQNIETFRDAVRLDKGRRLLSGMLHVRKYSTDDDYIMTVDGDDLISCNLASFVRQNSGANGWYIPTGFFWEDGGKLLYKSSIFSRRCGTSHIVKIGLLSLPNSFDAAQDDYVKNMLGSHIFIKDFMEKQKTPLDPLSFPGAVYRINHSESHSKSSGLLGKVFLQNGVLKSPKKVISETLKFRLVNTSFKKEFWGV
ncbi:hypothetical protein [Phormidium tenue]|uniref:Galactosyl transferase n=1 Tax=Phormidium tenue NIES-30 TaxID=549789 RepID=A0A1U7J6A2_9CYAN|nr:hypothetical protein [Phormidium tenue]MBD2231997.1 galactosyl transferase [Phormidium tenue FACHB-1052]OKH48407.1 hypothetical protein NIES30_10305 [Phormidium tenue NIES-30]